MFCKLKRITDKGIHMIHMPIRKDHDGHRTPDLLPGTWDLDSESLLSDSNGEARHAMRGKGRATASLWVPLFYTHQVGGHLLSLWGRGTGNRIMTSFPPGISFPNGKSGLRKVFIELVALWKIIANSQ